MTVTVILVRDILIARDVHECELTPIDLAIREHDAQGTNFVWLVDDNVGEDHVTPPERSTHLLGWQREDWWTDPEMWYHEIVRHRRMIAEGQGEYDVVFLGDSITRRLEMVGHATLSRLKEEFSVLVLGIGGDRVQQVIWRVRNGEMVGYRAKTIVVLIGTNNNYGDKPEWTAMGIKRLLKELRLRQPQSKIVLSAIYPRGREKTDSMRVQNAKVNDLIRPFADNRNIFWFDIGNRFFNEDGLISESLMPDFVHPSETGYELWATELVPVLRNLCKGGDR